MLLLFLYSFYTPTTPFLKKKTGHWTRPNSEEEDNKKLKKNGHGPG